MNWKEFKESKMNEPVIRDANVPIPEDCHVVAKALMPAEIYAVGGCVRDYLFGKEPKDFDLACNLTDKEIQKRVRDAGLKVMLKNAKCPNCDKASKDANMINDIPYCPDCNLEMKSETFGVVFVSVTPGEEAIEVAPFRADVGVSDGRRPDEVEFGVSVEQDALRRDFTMNNLYYDFGYGRPEWNGKIIDFNPGGQGFEDIEAGQVRFVGEPEQRVVEDRFRIMRLFRFFSAYNDRDITKFLDEKTIEAIRRYGNIKDSIRIEDKDKNKEAIQLQPITPERIQGEFVKGIEKSKNTAMFLKGIDNLKELTGVDMIDCIFPGLNVDTNGINRVGNSKNINAVLAWLLRNNNDVSGELKSLRYPGENYESVQFLINTLHFNNQDNVEIFNNLNTRDRLSLKQDMTEFSNIIGHPEVSTSINQLGTYPKPRIDGNELKSQGFVGTEIGDEIRRQTGDGFRSFIAQNPN